MLSYYIFICFVRTTWYHSFPSCSSPDEASSLSCRSSLMLYQLLKYHKSNERRRKKEKLLLCALNLNTRWCHSSGSIISLPSTVDIPRFPWIRLRTEKHNKTNENSEKRKKVRYNLNRLLKSTLPFPRLRLKLVLCALIKHNRDIVLSTNQSQENKTIIKLVPRVFPLEIERGGKSPGKEVEQS